MSDFCVFSQNRADMKMVNLLEFVLSVHISEFVSTAGKLTKLLALYVSIYRCDSRFMTTLKNTTKQLSSLFDSMKLSLSTTKFDDCMTFPVICYLLYILLLLLSNKD